jgi:raffinose/stachyose/melibiose transport system permease protein
MRADKLRRLISGGVVNVIVALFSAMCLFPVAWMAYSSLKTKQEFAMDIMALPAHPQFDNYIHAFRIGEMQIYFFNSVLVSSVSVIILVAVSFLAAYALSRFRFRLNAFFYVLFISGLLVPVYGLLIPVFILFKRLDLLDHRITLILPYIAFGLPLAVFLFESFIKSIPREMEEASFIDGAGLPYTLRAIIFPMTAPAVATVTILSFLSCWNEFPFALVLLKTKALKTLPIGLTNFSGQFATDYTKLMAALMITIVPMMIVYFLSYKSIMKGMVAGAVKG